MLITASVVPAPASSNERLFLAAMLRGIRIVMKKFVNEVEKPFQKSSMKNWIWFNLGFVVSFTIALELYAMMVTTLSMNTIR